ncbi:hypothetical protein PRIPAC_87678 [Pristionchus pacificus]|uniref:PGM_PMM_II domain-containing protein n=1 Tax=Pristionchus pacificus TaxID=54126 RepID=A0A2A6B9B2_PRIPA|nr:hypothetical protein PRIPAC_87678 [Pristionchus pacificus]|eukprot:PDM62470.1 hypothetical protein PRIPAC_51912 [Pristionchus pacificus]
MSSDRLPSLMEPFHQLHSSTYEVDKRQPLMYPYKMHYQNGPISEYRKEFPSKNDRDDSSWKQSQSSITLPVLKSPECSSDSSEGYDNEKTMIERERTIITENEWAMRAMPSNQMNDVRWVDGYRVQVANLNTLIQRLVDLFEAGYGAEVVEKLIDRVETSAALEDRRDALTCIKKYRQGIISMLGGNQLRILIDSMHGATGPYVSTIFNDLLGCVGTDLLRTVPKPDFGGCHPDPNLTYAKDLVDRMRVGEVDMGAAFDGDGDRNMILGKSAFFVCPSDSLAVIANHIDCIPYFKNINVAEIVKEHWAEYGRNVFTRYDYENVESGGANLLMTFLEASMNASKGKELSANGVTYKVAHTDNFEYTDPVDGSVAKKQGLRVLFEDESRLVFRLCGTGSAVHKRVLFLILPIDPFLSSQDLLKPLVLIALDLCKMDQFTGRKAPTVIT